MAVGGNRSRLLPLDYSIVMPIIPRYSLTQTSTHVHVEISIPHVRVSPANLDLVIVDGMELHFYAPPTYLLKLTLPERVVDENGVEESLSCAVTDLDVATDEAAAENAGEHDDDGDDDDDDDDDTCIGAPASSTASAPCHRHLWTSDDLPKMQYNPEKNHGTIVIILRKEEQGFWQDLDLLGRLQQQPMKSRQESRSTNPLVAVIGDRENEEGGAIGENNTSGALEDLLSINQTRPNYGLFQQFSNVFYDYAREGLVHEMLECPNPDEVSANNNEDCEIINHSEEQNRRQMRLEMENQKFDSGRYLNDLHAEEEEDMIFDAAMRMVPHWMEADGNPVASQNNLIESVENITDRMASLSTSSSDVNTVFFTADESHLLATLPPQHTTFPMQQLSAEQRRSAFLTLTDILFAYAYDHRTTGGDPTVESSWTVMILSSSLSWLEHFNPPYDTIVDVIRWNIRRSLIYPYLRVYSLSRKSVDDVCRIILGGRRAILRCLLQLRRIMERSECHYLFNKLYIYPLIGWIQRCEESEVIEFGNELLMVTKHDIIGSDPIGKDCLGLGLVELEHAYLESDDASETASGEADNDDDDDGDGDE